MNLYCCSPDAASTWGRVFSAFKWRRWKGVVGYEGVEYGGGSVPPGQSLGLESEARILVIATVGALTRLKEEGGDREAGAVYAKRTLCSQRLWDVRKRYGVDKNRAEHLLECVKDWLEWALNRPVDDEPELPW